MDKSEEVVKQYLTAQGFTEVVYEPDGEVMPDFFVDGSIAVEVRRLNQNEVSDGKPRGLEDVAVPVQQLVGSVLL